MPAYSGRGVKTASSLSTAVRSYLYRFILRKIPDQWLVEKLLDKRRERVGRSWVVKYLVRWMNCGPEEDSWVVAQNIEQSLVDEYESSHHAARATTTRSTRKSHRRRS